MVSDPNQVPVRAPQTTVPILKVIRSETTGFGAFLQIRRVSRKKISPYPASPTIIATYSVKNIRNHILISASLYPGVISRNLKRGWIRSTHLGVRIKLGGASSSSGSLTRSAQCSFAAAALSSSALSTGTYPSIYARLSSTCISALTDSNSISFSRILSPSARTFLSAASLASSF